MFLYFCVEHKDEEIASSVDFLEEKNKTKQVFNFGVKTENAYICNIL